MLGTLVAVGFLGSGCGDEPSSSGTRPEVLSVELGPERLELSVGESQHLAVVVRGRGSFDRGLFWETSDESVATVEDGVVTGVAPGEATITARSAADGKKSASVAVTVLPAEVGELVIEIEGLPDGLVAPIHVEGPGGFEADLEGGGRIRALPPGRYGVRAGEVEDELHLYRPEPAREEVDVVPGKASRIAIRYEATKRPPFRLRAREVVLPLFGSAEMQIEVDRRQDFGGAVEVRLERLPGGVSATSVHVAPDASAAVVRLESAGTYRVLGPRTVTLVGEAEGETVREEATLHIEAVVTDYDGGDGSLESYIALLPSLVNARGGPVEITFDADPRSERNVYLASPLEVRGRVVLRGPVNAAGPVVQIHGAPGDRALVVHPDSFVEIEGLAFTYGRNVRGGHVHNQGELIIRNSYLRDGGADEGGGSIANDGVLRVESTRFVENFANVAGGAVDNQGEATFVDVGFEWNGAGRGGAIHLGSPADGPPGRIVVERGTFVDNLATTSGGAILVGKGSSAEIRDSFSRGNQAASGGAISVDEAKLRVEASTFHHNEADLGGAIHGEGPPPGASSPGMIEVRSSLFLENEANAGGAIYTHLDAGIDGCTFDGNVATAGDGGASALMSGSHSVLRSLFTRNRAVFGGAIASSGDLVVDSCLLFLNGDASTLLGGAIESEGTTLVQNSTIANNTANQGGGIHVSLGELSLRFATVARNLGHEKGGGLAVQGSGRARIGASILAGNGSPTSPDVLLGFGDVASEGYNLFGVLDGGLVPDDTDLVGEDALLSVYGDFGGPMPSLALDPQSPAVDAIPEAACVDHEGEPLRVDQRGYPRPSGSGCDIGAFER